ncbi:MAG: hypothetical protein ACI4GO_01705 [Hominenteromicrobium sp.]
MASFLSFCLRGFIPLYDNPFWLFWQDRIEKKSVQKAIYGKKQKFRPEFYIPAIVKFTQNGYHRYETDFFAIHSKDR